MIQRSLNREGDSRNVLRQIDQLQRMTMPQLRQKWRDLFGNEAGKLGREYLLRRLAYRIQELVLGGLSTESQRLLGECISQPEKSAKKRRKREQRDLQPGTRLLREWHGKQYEVVVQPDGFQFDGQIYRSLSQIARLITGSHRGGRRFFGLKPSVTKERKPK
jgi:Protein of unknown function (DUF2924)